MKRIVATLVIALAGVAAAMAGTSNGPIAMDWHPGTNLYLLLKNGSVSIIDGVTKRRVAQIPPLFGMVPAEVYSARLKEGQFIFVSGFWGRTGSIWQYTAEGKPYARFETPEQGASFDVDPARRLVYVASPVTSIVYSISLDQGSAAPKRVAYLRDAEAVGPLILDRGRNRLLVGDVGRGIVYDVDPATGSYQQLATNVGRPMSLATDATYKTLFVADALAGRIFLFRLENGAFKQAEVIPTGLRTLSTVTMGPDDTVFLGDGVNAYQLSLKTKKLTRIPF